MKLLFDENLSPKLVGMLSDVYPDSTHVRDIGLARGDDEVVWSYAKDHAFVIVSKDAASISAALSTGLHRKSSGSAAATAPLRTSNASSDNIIQIFWRSRVIRMAHS